MNTIMTENRILIIKFKNPLYKHEIEMFRGAILNKIKNNSNILFHNHTENGFRYAYPLIQYKRINQKAAIVCMDEGVDVIGKVLSVCNDEVLLGNRKYQMEVDEVQSVKFDFHISDKLVEYNIENWIPLNQSNLEKYNTLHGIADKCNFLENILVGNILSLAKGLGIHLDSMINCHILQINDTGFQTFKGVQFLSLDLIFTTNVCLPDFVGLGKGTSLNHGTVVRTKKEDNKIRTNSISKM